MSIVSFFLIKKKDILSKYIHIHIHMAWIYYKVIISHYYSFMTPNNSNKTNDTHGYCKRYLGGQSKLLNQYQSPTIKFFLF
jgi:hypothetical protein